MTQIAMVNRLPLRTASYVSLRFVARVKRVRVTKF
jgi:hypothetical protein